MRLSREGLALDTAGFELIKHRSSLSDWSAFQDGDRVKAVDYPEVAAALRQHTGAEKVVISTTRCATAPSNPVTVPVCARSCALHDDQTFDSAPRRVARHLSPDEPSGVSSAGSPSSIFGGLSRVPCGERRSPCVMPEASSCVDLLPVTWCIGTGPERPIRWPIIPAIAGIGFRTNRGGGDAAQDIRFGDRRPVATYRT